jgi:DNA-3-methyladenine glycosylase I
VSLEGAQAGLSWATVLGRREGYRRAFAGFDPDVVATWGEAEVERLVAEPGIIRHRGKVASVVSNAQAVVALRTEGLDLDRLLWGYVGGVPLQPRFASPADLPVTTEVARRMSREMKRRGFSFFGPTIAYALMQSAGLTNDHLTSCYRFAELAP